MTREEFTQKIDDMIKEAESLQKKAKQNNDPLEEMFRIGQQNGLLQVKLWLFDLEK